MLTLVTESGQACCMILSIPHPHHPSICLNEVFQPVNFVLSTFHLSELLKPVNFAGGEIVMPGD